MMLISHTLLLLTVKADNPSKVQVLDMTKNHVKLGWTRPNKDGGDKIQGYVIEYKKIGEHWAKYNDKPVQDNSVKSWLLMPQTFYQST